MLTQTRSIIAVIAATFMLSLAIMWPWHKGSGPARIPIPVPMPASVHQADTVPDPPPLLLAPPPDIPATARAPAATGGGAIRPAMVVAPSNLDGPPLPIIFNITHRPSSR